MCDSQTSCVYNVKANSNDDADVKNKIKAIECYFDGRMDEIRNRLLEDKRSIFDFVDMAVMIGALANVTDTQSKCDTDQYIDFVKSEFISAGESHDELVATAFYCLMRCGLIHEMSLGSHNIRPNRQMAINGYSIGVTHDKSPNSKWYVVDGTANEIVFYAHELLDVISTCLGKCFDGRSDLWSSIRNKVLSPDGIKIIGVK